jgi:hypothetical protein
MRYEVQVVATVGGSVVVEAESATEAEDLALWRWNQEDGKVVERFAFAEEQKI